MMMMMMMKRTARKTMPKSAATTTVITIIITIIVYYHIYIITWPWQCHQETYVKNKNEGEKLSIVFNNQNYIYIVNVYTHSYYMIEGMTKRKRKNTQNIKWMQTATTNTSRVNTTNLFNLWALCTHQEMICVIEKFPFHSSIYHLQYIWMHLFSMCVCVLWLWVCSFWYVLLSMIRLIPMKMTRNSLQQLNFKACSSVDIQATYRFWTKIIWNISTFDGSHSAHKRFGK